MSGLVAFYESHINGFSDQNLLKLILGNKKIDEATILTLVQECREQLINTPYDLTQFYKKLLTITLLISRLKGSLDPLLPHLNALIEKGETEKSYGSFQFYEATISIAKLLINKHYDPYKVTQLEKGGVLFESGGYFFDRNIIKPQESVLLSLIWVYLGWVNYDEEIFNAGLNLVKFCMNFCDKDERPFKGLWTQESEYDPLELYSNFSLLSLINSYFKTNSKDLLLIEKKLEKIKSVENQKIDILNALLRYEFCNLIHNNTPFPDFQETLASCDVDPSLAFLKYDFEDLSLAWSGCGVNTGLGTIHKKYNQVVSFGPQYSPLSNLSYFGIYRNSNGSSDGFKDVKIEKEVDKCQLSGWTRLVSPRTLSRNKNFFLKPFPSDQWVFFDMLANKDIINIETRVNKIIEETHLFFTFFIISDKVITQENKTIKPASLEQYQGKNQPLIFEKQGEILHIVPLFEGDMRLIPLAGQTYFWSANFLLTFSIKKRLMSYSWKIQ